VAARLRIPVFGSGDCVTPEQIVERLSMGVAGVLVGRGVLRNPWILAQAADLLAGRPAGTVSLATRGQVLLAYIELLTDERVRELSEGHDRWVINKLRALGAYFTKGIEAGADFRNALNRVESIEVLAELIAQFFLVPAPLGHSDIASTLS